MSEKHLGDVKIGLGGYKVQDALGNISRLMRVSNPIPPLNLTWPLLSRGCTFNVRWIEPHRGL